MICKSFSTLRDTWFSMSTDGNLWRREETSDSVFIPRIPQVALTSCYHSVELTVIWLWRKARLFATSLANVSWRLFLFRSSAEYLLTFSCRCFRVWQHFQLSTNEETSLSYLCRSALVVQIICKTIISIAFIAGWFFWQ